MDPQATFIELRERMLGRAIDFKRLFLRTLQLYLNPDPGKEQGMEIWCEPSWQLVGQEGVVAGSGTIDFDPEAEDPDSWQRIVSQATDVLEGCLVEDVAVDARTFELEIRLSDGWAIRTFVSDPTEPEQWLLRAAASDLWVRGTPAGLRLGPPSRRSFEDE